MRIEKKIPYLFYLYIMDQNVSRYWLATGWMAHVFFWMQTISAPEPPERGLWIIHEIHLSTPQL
jgi:hypothetical protein